MIFVDKYETDVVNKLYGGRFNGEASCLGGAFQVGSLANC